jgi:hypothetical protein
MHLNLIYKDFESGGVGITEQKIEKGERKPEEEESITE